ncbi:hypothetical protein LTR36_001636 [Oleoguttula mirabilis]|uniref:GAG-pre-integrase domain-containing protein n=1 Tax=Oleoguttula mirabilis TaxID=1507867 RepID=A0AAV9JNG2_9PEZI|nr:hypothetical protein LTR36_001636 [Oleoguttula mirabilis]
MLSGSDALPRTIPSLHAQLLGEESQLKASGKLKIQKKGADTGSKGKDKDKDKDTEGGHHCNSESKDKPPEVKQFRKQVTLATIDTDDLAEAENALKKKKKQVLCMAYTPDRDKFAADIAAALNTSHTPKVDPVISSSLTALVACTECDTIGFHITEDHEFAMEYIKIRNDAKANERKSATPSRRSKLKSDKASRTDHTATSGTSLPLILTESSANPSLQAPTRASLRGTAGAEDGGQWGSVNDLLERLLRVFSGAKIKQSGANICIVNDKKWFKEFRALDFTIGTADEDVQIRVEGGGTIELPLCVDGEETVDLVLTTVAYAPNARCNILSLSWIDEKEDDMIGIALLIDGLYHVQVASSINPQMNKEDEEPVAIMARDNANNDNSSASELGEESDFEEEAGNEPNDAKHEEDADTSYKEDVEPSDDDSTSGEEDSDNDSSEEAMDVPEGVVPPKVVPIPHFDENPVWIWHRKLGHLGLGNMRKLLKMSIGIPITDKQIKAMLGAICPICAVAKATKRVPKEPATRRAKDLGVLIHADS